MVFQGSKRGLSPLAIMGLEGLVSSRITELKPELIPDTQCVFCFPLGISNVQRQNENEV